MTLLKRFSVMLVNYYKRLVISKHNLPIKSVICLITISFFLPGYLAAVRRTASYQSVWSKTINKLPVEPSSELSFAAMRQTGCDTVDFVTSRKDFAVGASPRSVAMGDLNGDSKLDLVSANEGENTLSVLLGVGDGTFGAKTDFEGQGNSSFVLMG